MEGNVHGIGFKSVLVHGGKMDDVRRTEERQR